MIQVLKRCMEPYLDQLMKILLKKGSDPGSTFITEEADKALNSVCTKLQDSKVLSCLLMQNVNSKSNLMRLRICKCLQVLVIDLGNNILFFKESDKLIAQLAHYLGDAGQEVRQVAKMAFLSMQQNIMGQNDLEKLLQRVLNEA